MFGTSCRNSESIFFQNEFSTGAYTHHQKSVICDAANPMGGSQRRLIAFVGGLDLTGGRYDTPGSYLANCLLVWIVEIMIIILNT